MKKPSVTQIIGFFNPATDFMNDDSALEFGRNTHTTTRLYDKKLLDVSNIDPLLKSHLDGWKKFIDDFEPKFSGIEKRLENDNYSGGYDRIGIIWNDRASDFKKRFVLDIKTGGLSKHPLGLQLSAYANLLNWEIDIAYGIQLKPGGYTLAYYPKKELKRYYRYFSSMLNTYNFINRGFKL